MLVKKHTFRRYDIRGIVGKDFEKSWVERLGRALGTYFLRHGERSAILGRDCRPSSPEFLEALTNGLCATGVDVICLGMVPTPALYFAMHHLARAAGVIITASHNPPEYNGFKIWLGKTTIHGLAIQEIRTIFEAGEFATGQGLACEHDILPAYVQTILSRVRLARPLTVVADAGNGSGGPALLQVLEGMGARVIPLHCDPDGTFPHHHPDPTIEENMVELTARVRAEGADLGIGLDGDADRLGVVDAQGRLLAGDELLAIYARDLLERQPGALILGDVKCSDRLFDDIRRRGGTPRMCVTGHSPAKALLLELDAPLGGELSGHIYFNEGWFGFDDAIYGAARLLDILSRLDTPLTALPGWPPACSTREILLPCPEERKEEIISRARAHFGALYPIETIDGVRVTFPQGWGLVRASHTQPALTLRFEAATPEQVTTLRRKMEDRISAWITP